MPYFELTDDGINYCYDGVAGSILPGYADAEGVQAYIEDEVFERDVMSRYANIDMYNRKDRERVEKRKAKTAAWLMKQIANF